jgi:hypothetical protein
VQDAAQLQPDDAIAILANSLSIRESIDLVLADLPSLPDPNMVAFVDVAKADALRRRLAARRVLQSLSDALS